MAIFTKKGKQFDTTGHGALRPGRDEQRLQGLRRRVRSAQQRRRRRALRPARRPLADRDADLLARVAERSRSAPADWQGRRRRRSVSVPGRPGQPGAADAAVRAAAAAAARRRHAGAQASAAGQRAAPAARARTAMCYAISTGADPLGPYYRYEFVRPLFPDYPRPAIWPDGYYVPTSTGDDRSRVIATQKHACVADRAKMLKGEPATEQCVDHRQRQLPQQRRHRRQGAAAARRAEHHDGGRRHAARRRSSRTTRIYVVAVPRRLEAIRRRRRSAGPTKIAVAPYHYLCDGQLTNCVPQPGTERRLDAQGDKIMARLVYRRDRQSRVDRRRALGEHRSRRRRRALVRVPRSTRTRDVALYQQGTYAPDGVVSLDGEPGDRSTAATSASATRSAARRTSPASGSPAGSPAIRRAR